MGLFARPAYAETDVSEGNKNIFSHSDKYDPSEAIRRRREKAEKEKARQERRERKERKSSAIHIKDEDDGASVKRRRITAEEGAGPLNSVGLSAAPLRITDEGSEDIQHDSNAQTMPSRMERAARRERSRVSPRKASGPTIVEIGESDEDGGVKSKRSKLLPERPLPDEDDESDPEFAELKMKARAKRLACQEAVKKSLTPDTKSPTPGQSQWDASRHRYATPPLPDPPVKLLITSDIPDSKPLRVYRKLSQRLQEIREVWCKKQDFSPEFAKQVIFTYRLRRVYDSTTCRTLGLEVGVDGETIIMKGAEDMDGVDHVHIEAMTTQMFEQKKMEKAEEEKKAQNMLRLNEDAAEVAAREQAAPDEAKVRLYLKAKGHAQPFKLSVKPSSKIAKIIYACRIHFGAQERQSVFLEFDGERINPDSLVQDTEIEDEDTIDVHIA
ncbi:Ubiquitin-2 like Rad60 SUMO-like [Teratosphaeria destructans]|uniref:Ubiquitin-2 like Rad60 SUMO-like n=1 Tax=Teratosphaeria destructans TaxID=418781 RepID=A0A9W7W6F2_9PEZI|nr:Ubiquitin-2 like Rad60 SUMO-like [Teratosphaeria destructans]